MTTRRYTKDRLEAAVVGATSVQDVLRNLGVPLAGGTHVIVRQRLQEYGIPIPVAPGRLPGRANSGWPKRTPEEVLRLLPEGSPRAQTYQLRRALAERGRPYVCEACGQEPMWNDKPLVLQVDHLDGNRMNCTEDNLRILCLHCHSQTETYCRKKRDMA